MHYNNDHTIYLWFYFLKSGSAKWHSRTVFLSKSNAYYNHLPFSLVYCTLLSTVAILITLLLINTCLGEGRIFTWEVSCWYSTLWRRATFHSWEILAVFIIQADWYSNLFFNSKVYHIIIPDNGTFISFIVVTCTKLSNSDFFFVFYWIHKHIRNVLSCCGALWFVLRNIRKRNLCDLNKTLDVKWQIAGLAQHITDSIIYPQFNWKILTYFLWSQCARLFSCYY